MKEKLINEIILLISNPEYVADIKRNFTNHEYLTKVHGVLKSFLDIGYPEEQMLSDIGEYRLKLQKGDKEAEEELVVEAITFLEGWCAPEWSLKDYKK